MSEPVPDVSAPAAAIGDCLRKARLATRMEPAEIACKLRLHVRQIEQLEKNQFALFSNPLFVKGYLRAYADLVGLEGALLVARYEREFPQMPVRDVAPRRILASEFSRPAAFPFRLVVVGVLLLVLLVMAVYWRNLLLAWLPHAGLSGQAPVVAPVEAAATMDNEASVAPSSSVEPPVPADAPDGVEPEPESLVASGQPLLHMEFSDDCWVQVKNGRGLVVHEVVHRAGESVDLPVQPPLTLWFGKAVAVARVSFRGKPVVMPVKSGFQSVRFVVGGEPKSGEVD